MISKTSYASVVLLMFLRNIGKSTNSIQQTVDFADMQLEKLGMKCSLSYTTKYRIIKEMQSVGLLDTVKKKIGEGITISNKVEKYFRGKDDGKEKSN